MELRCHPLTFMASVTKNQETTTYNISQNYAEMLSFHLFQHSHMKVGKWQRVHHIVRSSLKPGSSSWPQWHSCTRRRSVEFNPPRLLLLSSTSQPLPQCTMWDFNLPTKAWDYRISYYLPHYIQNSEIVTQRIPTTPEILVCGKRVWLWQNHCARRKESTTQILHQFEKRNWSPSPKCIYCI